MASELWVMQFWSEIILVTSNRSRPARLFDFELTHMISDQTALHSVQLPLLINKSWIYKGLHNDKHPSCQQFGLDGRKLTKNVLIILKNKVIDCWRGSLHDSRVLRNSELFATSGNKFPCDYHLIDDGGIFSDK